MAIYVGSARYDENKKSTGGTAGDQLQSATDDYKGEVSMQTMYTHSKGWYIFRAKKVAHASALAAAMKTACNNANIGYDQNQRTGILTYGTASTVKTECDCSALVRQCIKEATGTDVGNFTTATEATMLEKSGLFEEKIAYVSQSKTPVYNGDILVTKTKGHTVIVVSGSPRIDATTTTGTTVKATEAAKSKASGLAGTYTVTASALNVRHGAGTDKAIMVAIPKGTQVKNYGYYTAVGGVKWLYVQTTYHGTTCIGFCSERYLQKR